VFSMTSTQQLQPTHFDTLSEEKQTADLHSRLVTLGYDKRTSEEFATDLSTGFDQGTFTDIVFWLCQQISVLYGLDETVKSQNNVEHLLYELSALLTELDCTETALVTGDLMKRFEQKKVRIALLNFLLPHVKSARLIGYKRFREERDAKRSKQKNEGEALLSIMNMLEVESTDNTTVDTLFGTLNKESQKLLSSMARHLTPLFTSGLSEKQWQLVDTYAKELSADFQMRSDLVIQRLDVTVESFLWSDRVQKLEKRLMAVYKPGFARLRRPANLYVEDLLAATTELLAMYKASSVHIRKEVSNEITGYMLDQAPLDRGGRTSELVGFSPETSFGGHGRRGGGWGRRHGGGGGYNRQHRNQQEHHVESQVKQEMQNTDQRSEERRGGGAGGQQRGGGNRHDNAYGIFKKRGRRH
jgi:hypothetical protein